MQAGDQALKDRLSTRASRRRLAKIASLGILFDGRGNGLVWNDGWMGPHCRGYPRHSGGMNIWFGDGHVVFRKPLNPLQYQTVMSANEWYIHSYYEKYYWTY